MRKETALVKNYFWLDITKFVLCFLVIAIHIGPFTSYSKGLNYFFVEVLARIAVPFFFVSSGFLLYVRNKGIKSYCLNMFRMYVVWTIIYLPLYFFKFSDLTLGARIKSFLIYGTYTHLWFLLACSVAPVVCLVVETIFGCKMKYVVLLFLFVVGACSQTYYWLAVRLDFANIIDVLRSAFLSLSNGVFFAPIFFALGKTIADLESNRKTNKYSLKTIVSLTVLCFVLLICEAYLCWKMGEMQGFEFYFLLIPLSYFLLIFILKLDSAIVCKRNGVFFRKLSTVIFLIHLYVKECVFVGDTLLQYILCCIVSVVVGVLLLVLQKRMRKTFYGGK